MKKFVGVGLVLVAFLKLSMVAEDHFWVQVGGKTYVASKVVTVDKENNKVYVSLTPIQQAKANYFTFNYEIDCTSKTLTHIPQPVKIKTMISTTPNTDYFYELDDEALSEKSYIRGVCLSTKGYLKK